MTSTPISTNQHQVFDDVYRNCFSLTSFRLYLKRQASMTLSERRVDISSIKLDIISLPFPIKFLILMFGSIAKTIVACLIATMSVEANYQQPAQTGCNTPKSHPRQVLKCRRVATQIPYYKPAQVYRQPQNSRDTRDQYRAGCPNGRC
ncbi:hypothetical protein BC833DRAFT_562588 [Globomyces pollinis-pini]|nr:hypothetical protein BC833DRAFT_562588 [Globomyces pollinis-pini]